MIAERTSKGRLISLYLLSATTPLVNMSVARAAALSAIETIVLAVFMEVSFIPSESYSFLTPCSATIPTVSSIESIISLTSAFVFIALLSSAASARSCALVVNTRLEYFSNCSYALRASSPRSIRKVFPAISNFTSPSTRLAIIKHR